MDEMRQFWMVYGIGCGAPTYRHETKQSAVQEAQRLARLHKGVKFVVLQATEAYVDELRRIDLRPEPQYPF
jgi:hypothetical protein